MSEAEAFLLGFFLLGPAIVWPFIYALSVFMTWVDPWRGAAWQALAKLHSWLWFFAGPGYLWMLSDAAKRQEFIFVAFALLTLALWWDARTWPDDDQWKRRKKKAKEVVAVIAGRLVTRVAPA